MMTSDEAVVEPYLDFVVEARWPDGRLLREYTVLLDPPVYETDTVAVSASQRVEEVEGAAAAGGDAAKKKDSGEFTYRIGPEVTEGTAVEVRESDLGPGQMPQRGYNASAAGAPAAGGRIDGQHTG